MSTHVRSHRGARCKCDACRARTRENTRRYRANPRPVREVAAIVVPTFPDAPCAGRTALWFSTEPADVREATTICATCPHRVACLYAAIDRHEDFGVWGGENLNRASSGSYWSRQRGVA